jgi:hypothetical protein
MGIMIDIFGFSDILNFLFGNNFPSLNFVTYSCIGSDLDLSIGVYWDKTELNNKTPINKQNKRDMLFLEKFFIIFIIFK